MSARPHAFVVMPFGVKPGPRNPKGELLDPANPSIDFNRVYEDYIRPSLELAGFEPFRADEELRAGNIIEDMFQELLVADLVVADLTIENPNVWYELGVRHALRPRGVVIVCGGRTPTAFDLYTDRKLRYELKGGAPDPDRLEEDRAKLVKMIEATMDVWHGRKISPVYNLLEDLQEPDWKSLRIGAVGEFWERHDRWEQRIDLARRTGRIGDLLVLANEAPIAAFRVDAWVTAGKALRKAGRYQFALEHLEHGLDRDPDNLEILRETGICLQRLAIAGVSGHSLDRARQHYQNALAKFPRDAEMWALLGRIDKDAWIAAWKQPDQTPSQRREEARYQKALLRAAIESYTKAYRSNPGHYYSGINALTLMHLYGDLTGDKQRYESEMGIMVGAIRFAASCEPDPKPVYWAKATLGDLEVLVGTVESLTDAYMEAIATNENDWFALDSSRAQLQMLLDLEFHPDQVNAGIATFDRALNKLEKPKAQPRQVILFSGHLVDAPNRQRPRFPADKEPIAAQKIGEALDELGAGPEDLALSQAAAGGDLLFLEACQQRGVKCQILLPFAEPEFIDQSILPSAGGERWRERYLEVKKKVEDGALRIMPDELGALPSNVNAFERCNLWLLYTTLAFGIKKTRFICLWNGDDGDGPGGTKHMRDEVKKRTDHVKWLDTRDLWSV